MSKEPLAQTVVDFWFADAGASASSLDDAYRRWFSPDPSFDSEIERRFGKLVPAAAEGKLSEWEGEPAERLALILLLDQFPRNLYRGTARAFASDAQALRLTIDGLDEGTNQSLSPLEQIFFCMPLQHAENRDIQERSVRTFDDLATAECSAHVRTALDKCAGFARVHRDIIERFGRFPHRNKVLERTSTPEEIAYLNDGGLSFGQ